MSSAEAPTPLTADDKRRVWAAIRRKTQPDDREPRIVIDDRYGGDEDAYLRAMAEYHGVSIGSATTSQ